MDYLLELKQKLFGWLMKALARVYGPMLHLTCGNEALESKKIPGDRS